MLQQYIEFLYPGSFVDNTQTRPVDGRQPPTQLPEGCFGYRFFAREEVRQGDEVLSGKSKDFSGYTYFGKALTIEDVERLPKTRPDDYKILLSNMRNNNWPRVVLTICGNFKPLEECDECKEPRGDAAS